MSISEEKRRLHREYVREWRKREVAARRPQKLLAKGRCPVCEMFLVDDYHINFGQDHIHRILLMIQGVSFATASLPILVNHEKNDLSPIEMFNKINGII